MKKIKIVNWKAKDGDKDIEENIVNVLTALLSFKDPKTMPTGFKQALMFSRILKAFENKEELILDDEDYNFLKKMIETDTPSIWGSNINIMKALEDFNNEGINI
jgi:transcription antitermination factor NusA-like protein